MRGIRESIKQDKFPQFIKDFMDCMFPDKDYPAWVVDALRSVNVNLETSDNKENKEVT